MVLADPASTRPSLLVLGRPKVVLQAKTFVPPVRHIAILSLACLEGRIARSELARLLWPLSSSSAGRHSLSQALYSLKKALNDPDVLHVDSTAVELGNLATDVASLRQAVSASDWPGAAKLFTGPLLHGVVVPGANEYNDWVESQRNRFSIVARQVIDALYLEASPLAPDLAERLSIVFDAASHRQAVEDAYRTPPLVDVAPSHLGAAPFIGRNRELNSLEGLYRDAIENRVPRAVIVRGEQGIGKTSFLQRFVRLRALRGSQIAYATGYQPEQNLAFGIAGQWLRELDVSSDSTLDSSTGDARFVESYLRVSHRQTKGRPPSSNITEYRILEGLRQGIVDRAASRPVILALDDAQFADPASLTFAHYLVRRSSSAAVLFVATIRTSQPASVDLFAGWQGINLIDLRAFDRNETHMLIGRCRPGLRDRDTVDSLHRMSGGNPLLLVSLLGAESLPEDGEVPQGILDYFLPQLRDLVRSRRLLLAAIAISPAPTSFDLTSRIAGVPINSGDFLDALSELEARGLIEIGSGSTATLRHGVLGEVAIAALSPADGRVLHARAARVFTEEGKSPSAVLAVQHDIGGQRRQAFETALEAAAASESLHAVREREFFLKLALSNAPDELADIRIRIEIADFFRRIGKLDEAREILNEEVFRSIPTPLRERAKASQLALRLSGANRDDQLANFRVEVQSLVDKVDHEVAAELYYLLAAAAHGLGLAGEALAATRQALSIAKSFTMTPKTAFVAARSAVGVGLHSSAEEGLAEIRNLIPFAESDPEALCECYIAHATLLVAAGRLIEAESRFLESIDLSERYYLFGALFGLHNNLGVCYTEQGRYEEATSHLTAAIRAGEEFGVRGDRGIASDNLALLHFERGAFKHALESARPANAFSPSAPRSLYYRHAIVGLCSLELGLLAQAFEAKREIEILFDQHEYWSNDMSYVEMFLARMLVLEDRVDEARERLATAIEVYRQRDVLCRARLELELGRIELKRDPAGALERATRMQETLRGTGARPLVDRFEELADRARHRGSA
jgi:tetratricopeptide (TPR) repeat protein